ncbi:hypothetical protein TNIN_381081 [Trichonephila inaurata madagascariensis]|uniref:Uncharacterized protein n=1 Tax=Trichonephila inaurata madagascariensis TaxID=2747483 RepID=A0A8X6X529_9ARAC|nr:hypothetical protein TNIN_381081 [Trichonephila inaurata madagascariensis]
MQPQSSGLGISEGMHRKWGVNALSNNWVRFGLKRCTGNDLFLNGCSISLREINPYRSSIVRSFISILWFFPRVENVALDFQRSYRFDYCNKT